MTITAAPKSVPLGRDLGFGIPLIAAGIGCLVLLALSDARGKVSFPPDDSLYSVQNWLQVVAIAVGGLMIAIPKVPKSTKATAGGVVLISAGLLLGTAVVAMKHWRPHGGMASIPVKRTDSMEQLSATIAVTAVVIALLALWWLARTGALSTRVKSRARTASVITGVITIGAVPIIIGIGSSETMDATSLGAFALIYSLPWGVAFLLAGFLTRPAALGALGSVATSAALTILTPPMPSLVFGTAVPAGFVVLLVSGWLITMRKPGVNPPTA